MRGTHPDQAQQMARHYHDERIAFARHARLAAAARGPRTRNSRALRRAAAVAMVVVIGASTAAVTEPWAEAAHAPPSARAT